MPHLTAETVPAGTGPQPSGAGSRRAILSGAVGNALEWYDFAVYGYFASIIGANFFPAENPVASLMATFGVFAAAFLARPFGSVVFGHVGDRFGRRSALILSVTLMATTTTLVGLLPTYETIGAAAPILLVALRLLQGLSVGGEHTTSVIFLVEHAPPKRKALYGSFAVVAVAVGTLLGSAVGALLEILLDPAALSAWGWRIPFLLGAVLGVATFILRRSIAADAPAARQDLPIVRLFREDWRELLRGIGISATTAVTFYLTFVYLITYIERIDALSASTALRINTINMAALIVVFLASGLLADRIGLKAVLVAGAVCAIVLPWPLFLLLESGDVVWVALGQFGLAIMVGLYGGAYPAVMASLFPGDYRCSGVALSLNIAMALFGGTAPLVAVYLVNRLGWDSGPAFYIILVAVFSLVCVLTWRPRPEGR